MPIVPGRTGPRGDVLLWHGPTSIDVQQFKRSDMPAMAGGILTYIRKGHGFGATMDLRAMKVHTELEGWEREYRDMVEFLHDTLKKDGIPMDDLPFDIRYPGEVEFGLFGRSWGRRLCWHHGRRYMEIRRIKEDFERYRETEDDWQRRVREFVYDSLMTNTLREVEKWALQEYVDDRSPEGGTHNFW
jgi:hypothetical protein